MPKIQYLFNTRLSAGSLAVIDKANEIIEEYRAQGFDLTLRQLYYQFVARDIIPNKQNEYKRLGDIINNGRLAGLIDWAAITDRTRHLRKHSFWTNPQGVIDSAAYSYRLDKWAKQDYRVEAWIEKDALVGVISGVCDELEVPYFSCRGYVSQSEMWAAAQRIRRAYLNQGQETIVLHLGDHDPSGIDMTRDITDRIQMFLGAEDMGHIFEIKRLALNMVQVEEFNPPPNPAKTTDSRYASYIEKYGYESWELDALEPRTLAALIQDNVFEYRDLEKWEEIATQEEETKNLIRDIGKRFNDVCTFLKKAK
jgi:hypothetical protein